MEAMVVVGFMMEYGWQQSRLRQPGNQDNSSSYLSPLSARIRHDDPADR